MLQFVINIDCTSTCIVFPGRQSVPYHLPCILSPHALIRRANLEFCLLRHATAVVHRDAVLPRGSRSKFFSSLHRSEALVQMLSIFRPAIGKSFRYHRHRALPSQPLEEAQILCGESSGPFDRRGWRRFLNGQIGAPPAHEKCKRGRLWRVGSSGRIQRGRQSVTARRS